MHTASTLESTAGRSSVAEGMSTPTTTSENRYAPLEIESTGFSSDDE